QGACLLRGGVSHQLERRMPRHDRDATGRHPQRLGCQAWSGRWRTCEPSPRRSCPSDLTDTAWARIPALEIPTHTRGGRPCCEHRWREYVDALLFVVTTRIPWQALPHDFTVSWPAAYKHVTRWTNRRLWEQALAVLRAEDRVHDGCDQRPTAAVVDSPSVKSTPATLTAHEAFEILSQIRLLLRRLDRQESWLDRL
ncbi:MAG: transposase, partial [Cellulosimicrobium cellulans]